MMTGEKWFDRAEQRVMALVKDGRQMDARLSALFDRVCKLEDRLEGTTDALNSVARSDTSAPLPAPALTEQAIVDALKADPGMAGRVVAEFGMVSVHNDRVQFSEGARCRVQSRMGSTVPTGLQSLAVALAAASYRG